MAIVRRSALKWKAKAFKEERELLEDHQAFSENVMEAFEGTSTQFEQFLSTWDAEIVQHDGGKECLRIVVEPTFV